MTTITPPPTVVCVGRGETNHRETHPADQPPPGADMHRIDTAAILAQLDADDLHEVDGVLCPTCHADAQTPCRTKAGKTTTYHLSRIEKGSVTGMLAVMEAREPIRQAKYDALMADVAAVKADFEECIANMRAELNH